ncbi:LytR/AlgR family response regulator transcription factor [Dyella tabacisoli]|uniref:DNA-binding response regulator n=1 Tax=Dyella tabacisoli TaxID=2282381 RepID=A0A369UNV4_9GAMM|nr:LytTR family DNA-binding domain-containing protein [Dyella tabacisoli]RDD81300.1 DNA-binding response regulator [Dyella tabacisoli]
MIKTIIVDDESLARRGVRVCLRHALDVQVVAEADSGWDAIEKITAFKPDLIFLDVQMPGMDGFEMLAKLPSDAMPLIIFLTAHDDYALQAFSVHAMDYVLKPIDDQRFDKALDSARTRLADRRAGEQLASIKGLLLAKDAEQKSQTRPDHFVTKSGTKTFMLEHSDVDWIEASGDYVTLHAGKRSYLIRETMDSLERQLDPARFIRIHRSTMIALNRLSGYNLLPSRDALVTLKDGTVVRASRRYRRRIPM